MCTTPPLTNSAPTVTNEMKSHVIASDALSHKYEHPQADVQMQTSTTKSNANNMTSSVASIADDSTTPSDSGIQILDSISSSGMNESLMSSSGLELDSSYPAEIMNNVTLLKQLQESADALALQFDVVFDDNGIVESTPIEQIANEVMTVDATQILRAVDADDNAATESVEAVGPAGLTRSDIDNSNVNGGAVGGMDIAEIPDVMMTSNCSTFDTENIVFRRKTKKQRTSSSSSASGPKKRVSFHEDILKSTKTDNIHIEHGFITYKGYSKKYPHSVARYSWYSQGDSDGDDDEQKNVYYRNACSDVLDYGDSNVYDQRNGSLGQYDNSGVFEYTPQPQVASPTSPTTPSTPDPPNINNNSPPTNENNQFYRCKCSSSSSSLESGDSLNSTDDENNKKCNYAQMKSNSCDCIGANPTNIANNNNVCTDNCYFSDPSIENDDNFEVTGAKSVWRKELKPKNSCLKKTKRQTGVIEEQDLTTKVKKFNVHQLSDVNQLIGSLRNIFSLTLPERGVPEGCEDLQPVYECLPDVDHQSPVNKPKSFLSKSFDNGLQKVKKERPKNFVHAVDEQLRRNNEPPVEIQIPMDEDMTDVAASQEKSPLPVEDATPASTNYRNKFIVNCESTVFEHTGVFYEDGRVVQPSPVPMLPMISQPPKPSVVTPFTQKLSNMFRSFRDSATAQSIPERQPMQAPPPLSPAPKLLQRSPQHKLKQQEIQKLSPMQQQLEQQFDKQSSDQHKQSQLQSSSRKTSLTSKCYGNDVEHMGTNSMTSSMISSISDNNSVHSTTSFVSNGTTPNIGDNHTAVNEYANVTVNDSPISSGAKSRHLASPLRRRSMTSRFDRSRLSPDLFAGPHRESVNPMDLISPEFDDLLTITTTDTDFNESDIEILDYPSSAELSLATSMKDSISEASNQYLRPPSSKSSLINRFLRNVTQKKIHDATIKKNNILSAKYREPPKLFGNLYVKPQKTIDRDLVADLNAEIALEIELNSASNAARNAQMMTMPKVVDLQQEFGVGVGEVCVDIFNGNALHILRDDKEILMKVCTSPFSKLFEFY